MSSSLKLPMTFEANCGHCHDRLMVESTADRAACPHCGTVLVVPDDESSLASLPTLEPAASDEHVPAFPSHADVTATEAMLAVSAIMKAVNIQVFELGMWQSWSGR